MLLTEKQAAAELQIDRRTLRRLIESGRLRAIDVGGGLRRHYRIAPAELVAIANAEATNVTPYPEVRVQSRRSSSRASIASYLPTV